MSAADFLIQFHTQHIVTGLFSKYLKDNSVARFTTVRFLQTKDESCFESKRDSTGLNQIQCKKLWQSPK